MKLNIDATRCDGYGVCAQIAPDIFKLDEWGYAFLGEDENFEHEEIELIQQAVADCPRAAIAVIEPGVR